MGWLIKRAGDLRLLSIFGAGVVMTAFAAGLVLILWLGGWRDHESQRIMYLGIGMLVCLALVGVVIAAITSRNLKIMGPGGSGLEVGGAPPPRPAPETQKTSNG